MLLRRKVAKRVHQEGASCTLCDRVPSVDQFCWGFVWVEGVMLVRVLGAVFVYCIAR